MDQDLSIVLARPEDLGQYLDVLEEVGSWLRSRGLSDLKDGTFHASNDYFSGSIGRGEVHLALLDGELAGTLRLLRQDRVVWPEILVDDAMYVYNLAIRRGWAGRQLGRQLLAFAENQTRSFGREYLRLDCLSRSTFLRNYYANSGFTDRGDIDAQYPKPVGILRLRRFEKPLG